MKSVKNLTVLMCILTAPSLAGLYVTDQSLNANIAVGCAVWGMTKTLMRQGAISVRDVWPLLTLVSISNIQTMQFDEKSEEVKVGSFKELIRFCGINLSSFLAGEKLLGRLILNSFLLDRFRL